MLEEGKVKAIGVSEVSAEELRKIHAIVPVSVVELECSLFSRKCFVSACLLHLQICLNNLEDLSVLCSFWTRLSKSIVLSNYIKIMPHNHAHLLHAA